MSRTIVSAVRVALTLVISCLPPAVLLMVTDWPLIAHVWIIGSIAVLFSFSELYFRSILAETNAVFRRPGYSVWQVEKLQQQLPSIRSAAWRYWTTSILLKAGTATAVLIVNFTGTSTVIKTFVVFVSYAVLIFASLLTYWARANYLRLEELADDLTAKEAAVREQKKLRADLESGTPHDFAKDKALQGYNKVIPLSSQQVKRKRPSPS